MSFNVLSRTLQMAIHNLIEGLNSPFSMAFMVCLVTPTRSANSFCDRSFAARAAFSFKFLANVSPQFSLTFYNQCKLYLLLCQIYITFIKLYMTCKQNKKPRVTTRFLQKIPELSNINLYKKPNNHHQN